MAHPGGRPKTTVAQKLSKITFDYDKIFELAKRGFTDEALAAVLGVSERTLNKWKLDKEFCSALKKGKDIADEIIEGSLFHRAKGYSHNETWIGQFQGQVITHETIKHYPPDTTAAIFWLKNRLPGRWRDKHEIEHSSGLTKEQMDAIVKNFR